MILDTQDAELRNLVARYVEKLDLPTENAWLTDNRRAYAEWLGRPIKARYGGAYVYIRATNRHMILVNLHRIDRRQPRAVEIVVCEELVHMRDHLDGDVRRHAHHGYDRIALRVAALTGATSDEVRSCLLPTKRRSLKYRYFCPGCQQVVHRRVRGIWSCGTCASRFDPRFQLRLLDHET